MSTRLLVLGGTGLLGSTVARFFLSNSDYSTVTTCRDKTVSIDENALLFNALGDSFDKLPTDFDYVINCIGIIKPFMIQDPIAAIKINSLLPWQAAAWCNENGMRFIHITTDCVYSGKKGKYIEDDAHDALDAYGKSKSLGECCNEAMVMRTSIIGEEIHKKASLIEWAKSQKGKTVGGFTTHLWNGITTNEYAKVCEKIISNGWYERGLFHIHAPDDVSKYQMLQYFDKRFELGLDIKKETPERIDRTLRTEKKLCEKLEIPTVKDMVMSI